LLPAALATSLLVSCSRAPPSDPRTVTFAALPDWQGYWTTATAKTTIDGLIIPSEPMPPPTSMESALAFYGKATPLLGADAPWNEEGRKKFAAMFAADLGKTTGGWGYPMMMCSLPPLQFLITPEEVLIVNFYGEVRHIHTDGRSLPAPEDRAVSTWGTSIGHWEGDTLVVETVAVRNPLDYFYFAPPLSGNAHYLERIRRTSPDSMEMEMIIEDPENLTGPWTTHWALNREQFVDSLVHDVQSNDRTAVEGGVFTIQPPKE
jgi:hypothetical protein